MSWILVTNDDGIDARALVPLARALGEIAPVRVVAPDGERSWIGKAITRYSALEVEQVVRGGIEMWSCTGTPADCVQLGIHTLFDEPPSLVVSGINLGYNHGTGYLHTSGTFGAILEAHIQGVDGLALSAGAEGVFFTWMAWASTPDADPMWERMAEIGTDLAGPMFEAAPQGVAVSANMPDSSDVTTERRLTTVAGTGYGPLFIEEEPGRYVHHYRGRLDFTTPSEGTDVGTVADGYVTVTPISMVSTASFPDALAPMLERRDP